MVGIQLKIEVGMNELNFYALLHLKNFIHLVCISFIKKTHKKVINSSVIVAFVLRVCSYKQEEAENIIFCHL